MLFSALLTQFFLARPPDHAIHRHTATTLLPTAIRRRNTLPEYDLSHALKTQLRIQTRRTHACSLQPDRRILLLSSLLKLSYQSGRQSSPTRIVSRSDQEKVVEMRAVSQLPPPHSRDRRLELAQHAVAARDAQLPQHLEEAGGYEGPRVVDALAWW